MRRTSARMTVEAERRSTRSTSSPSAAGERLLRPEPLDGPERAGREHGQVEVAARVRRALGARAEDVDGLHVGEAAEERAEVGRAHGGR